MENFENMENEFSGLKLEDLARHPMPGLVFPSMVKFSPDGQWLTYLFSQEGSLENSLLALNLENGQKKVLVSPDAGGLTEKNVSLEEELRRERLRQRSTGITKYIWAKKENKLLLPLGADLYILDSLDSAPRKLLAAEGQSILDPQFSPDGCWVSYVQDAEVYIIPAEGGQARQITSGARGTGKVNGAAEYVAQEEMGRAQGYWWSPDSRQIAFCEVDETNIPVYRIMHQGKDEVGPSAQEDHRYPFAGKENGRVRLGVTDIEGSAPVWMEIDPQKYEYIARVNWLPDGSLTAQLENRRQTQLDLVEFDLTSGKASLLLEEKSDIWINLNDIFFPLTQDGEEKCSGFIWASERTGFRHLYLYNRKGELLRILTEGDWQVDSLVKVDQKSGKIYFTSTRDGVTESHLYEVSLEGGEVLRKTRDDGQHNLYIDSGFKYLADIHHSMQAPPSVKVYDLHSGDLLQTVFAERDERIERMHLSAPEIFEMLNHTGTKLYGALYSPPESCGKGPYPLIISVYGGPHAQRVTNSWMLTVDLRCQYLARKGYLVLKIDNRGSARRGLAFEGVIKHLTYKNEISDQVDGVQYLVEKGLADPKKVGIFGWSYGGSMSIMSILQAPEVFKAAVVGAPVTDWRGYDTHYTERYMGTPQENPQGYEGTTAMTYVENLKGRILLIHGMIDENVHFRHTARLIKALHAAKKDYDLIIFPDSRHMPRKPEDLLYQEERILRYFDNHLRA